MDERCDNDQHQPDGNGEPVASAPDEANRGDDVHIETQSEDVPDDDEVFHNIPLDDKEPTYFIEDEEEENRRNEHLGLEPQRIAPNSEPKKARKKALISCKLCKKSYGSIETYVKHMMTHAMAGK